MIARWLRPSPKALANKIAKLVGSLPEGISMVVFLSAEQGDDIETIVLATLPPDRFAPVVRRWLERYDAGEATPAREFDI